jgi:hypothetical protein
MKNVLLLTLLSVLLSCGSATFKKDEVTSIKRVAIVAYSIPEKIEFRDDPKQQNKPGVMDLVKMVAKNFTEVDGQKAAELSYNEFVKSINTSTHLPFKALTLEELRKNSKFQELVTSTLKKETPVAAEPTGWMGTLQSFANTNKDAPSSTTVAGIATFGIDKNWQDSDALMKTEKEKEFLKKSLEILNVDAIMVINDMGYSFSCEACIGGTGSASTGSAFNVTLINKEMKSVMNVRQWFGFSKASAPIVTGIIPPPMYEKLFIAHGGKMASEFISETETQLK